jgi:hypothetical protein
MSWLIVTNYQFRNPNGSLFGFFVLLDRHVYYRVWQVCQWLAAGRWLYPGTPVSSTNKTGRHDITEILVDYLYKRSESWIEKGATYSLQAPGFIHVL